MTTQARTAALALIDFIDASPSPWHAVASAEARTMRPIELFAHFHATMGGAPLPEAARPVLAAAIAAAEQTEPD